MVSFAIEFSEEGREEKEGKKTKSLFEGVEAAFLLSAVPMLSAPPNASLVYSCATSTDTRHATSVLSSVLSSLPP